MRSLFLCPLSQKRVRPQAGVIPLISLTLRGTPPPLRNNLFKTHGLIYFMIIFSISLAQPQNVVMSGVTDSILTRSELNTVQFWR